MVMLDPPIGAKAAPMPNLEALLKEWGITPGNNVVVDVSGATNDPSIAVAATYPQHPITETFRTLTIYPLARIDRLRRGRHQRPRPRRRIVETSRRQLGGGEPRVAQRRAGVSMDETSGDKPGRSRLASRCRRPSKAPAAADHAGDRRGAEARDARRRLRRLRLRQQRLRRRCAGQPEPVRERRQLAGAAGEPDRHPADRSRRPPRHDDRRSSRRWRRSDLDLRAAGAGVRRRASTPGGGGGSVRGLTSTIVLLVVLGRPRRLHLFRRVETRPGRRRRQGEGVHRAGGRHDRGNPDQERRRRDVARAARRRQAGSLLEPNKADADAGVVGTVTSNLSTLEVQRVVDENPADLKQYGLEPGANRRRRSG